MGFYFGLSYNEYITLDRISMIARDLDFEEPIDIFE
jgi:hypothetical protein